MRIYESYNFDEPDALMTRRLGDMMDEVRDTFRDLSPRQQ